MCVHRENTEQRELEGKTVKYLRGEMSHGQILLRMSNWKYTCFIILF